MSLSIGKLFRLTTFGESHGPAIGGILEGCPAGLKLDLKYVQNSLDLRKPGTSFLSSQRREHDVVQFLSGVFNGVTLGTPIGFLIKNKDAKSSDYNNLKDVYRPSHADFTYEKKYGIRDHRGGGRSSARETANWVVAGSIASQILSIKGISIHSYVSSVGNISVDLDYKELDLDTIYSNEVRCPSQKVANKMINIIQECQKTGDTVGGKVFCVVKNLPIGLGDPVFGKLQADIARAVMSINACKGVEFGAGFLSSKSTGSCQNDVFVSTDKGVGTKTNNSGGVQGGISNGEDLFFQAAFKPVSTIMKNQYTIDKSMKNITINPSGRHDPCVVPRVVPIVDALVAIVILDHYLLNKTIKIQDL